jgi:hypothetical protein
VQRRAFGTADDVFSYSEQARRLTAGVEFITAPTGHDEIAQGKAKRRPGNWYTAGCNLALKNRTPTRVPATCRLLLAWQLTLYRPAELAAGYRG